MYRSFIEGKAKEVNVQICFLVLNPALPSSWFIFYFFLFSFLFSRVNDEKEARGYLQGLATKMTDELESVRAPGPPGTGKVNCISFLSFILHLF